VKEINPGASFEKGRPLGREKPAMTDGGEDSIARKNIVPVDLVDVGLLKGTQKEKTLPWGGKGAERTRSMFYTIPNTGKGSYSAELWEKALWGKAS